MKKLAEIRIQQKEFIENLRNASAEFIKSVDTAEIETVLLSGSVARGDYFPGGFCGMVDLIVMRRPGSIVIATELFGENQEPDIPFHCVRFGDVEFQILFTDFISPERFKSFDEARKFSILESAILYDKNGSYESALSEIKKIQTAECAELLKSRLGYIHYLLSDYKKDRWRRRGAFLQLHENLNTAIRLAVSALYYKNNSYASAEDRQLYYSLSLDRLPENYEPLIIDLKSQRSDSEENYDHREDLFRKTLLAFLEDSK